MVLSSIYKSLIRYVLDVISEINATMPGELVTYQDWENRFDENSLPRNTLLGIDGFNFDENQGLWIVRFGLALSSYRDANLLNEIDILDIIRNRTGEKQKIAMLHPETGEEVTEMVVAAWHLAPMAQSEYRNYRTISIELLRTENVSA